MIEFVSPVQFDHILTLQTSLLLPKESVQTSLQRARSFVNTGELFIAMSVSEKIFVNPIRKKSSFRRPKAHGK